MYENCVHIIVRRGMLLLHCTCLYEKCILWVLTCLYKGRTLWDSNMNVYQLGLLGSDVM